MADGGWIKMWRSILDWEYFDIQHRRDIWIYLLLKADYKTGTVKVTYNELIKIANCTINQARADMSALQKSKQIACSRNGNFLSVKILNWEAYQSKAQTYPQTFSQTKSQTLKKAQTIETNRVARSSEEAKPQTFSQTYPQTYPQTDITLYNKEDKEGEEEIHFLARNSAEVLERDALLYPDGWIE